jgi:hypothetical protein
MFLPADPVPDDPVPPPGRSDFDSRITDSGFLAPYTVYYTVMRVAWGIFCWFLLVPRNAKNPGSHRGFRLYFHLLLFRLAPRRGLERHAAFLSAPMFVKG